MTTLTDSTVITNTRAALQILEHAERTGLPLPFIVNAGDYDISMQFESVANVAAWAEWMEVQVDSEYSDHTKHVHHRAEGLALDAELTVIAIAKGGAR